jgi:hypothetical protein
MVLGFTLAFGLLGVMSSLRSGTIERLLVGLGIGLSIGLSIGSLSWLIGGLKSSVVKQEVSQRSYPNAGIRFSGWNAARMGLSCGLVFGGLYGIFFSVIGWFAFTPDPSYGLTKAGIMFGSMIGVLIGLGLYGGPVTIQHYTLRWVLKWANVLPYAFQNRRLVAFLDAMHDRILLRRVGGGWMFVHRSLLEHFANLPITTR